MRKIFITLLGSIAFCASLFAARQTTVILRGTAKDQAGEPAAYATAFITKADGSIAAGASADEQGAFELSAPAGEYTLTVALVGYKDAVQRVKMEGAVTTLSPIVLQEDTELLGEAVVAAVMPKTKLTGEGLQTSVHGSVLENVGTAKDVLGKVPGIIKGENGIEVIGKGTPLIYINGRKVTDAGELDRLLSHEIQSVEVINNPGAQYDATVRSVVRIRTVKRQGEGFGFDATLTDQQSLQIAHFNDPGAAFNVNYRTGGVDIFGGVNAARISDRQTSDIIQETIGATTFKQDQSLIGDVTYKDITLTGGVNWQIADNHSVGFKVDWNQNPCLDQNVLLKGDLFMDNSPVDYLETLTNETIGSHKPFSLGTNAYYNGQVGNLGIDLNLDYFGKSNDLLAHSNENSTIEDATVNTEAKTDSKLYAAKLVLSYPIWTGQLQLGTEETFSRFSDDYRISGAPIPASSVRVNEDNAAAFANYGFFLPNIGQISAGLRYEHVNYAYDDLLGSDGFSRRYDNVFPSVSYANAFGPVQVMASYSARTARPNFDELSSAIQYVNRYTLQSGNAALQPQKIQSLNLTTLWNYLTLVLNYDRTDNPIITWADLYNDQGVILLKPHNLETPHRQLSAYLNASPTIGCWTMNYTVGVQQSMLKVGDLNFNNKPLWIAELNNTFRFGKGWQLEFGGEFHSPGYFTNFLITNHYVDLSAAIQKTLLKDGSLVIRLAGSDLAGLGHNNVFVDLGYYRLHQSVKMDTQRVTLSIRYRFNTTQSKYKGTGAGQDTKSRMK